MKIYLLGYSAYLEDLCLDGYSTTEQGLIQLLKDQYMCMYGKYVKDVIIDHNKNKLTFKSCETGETEFFDDSCHFHIITKQYD